VDDEALINAIRQALERHAAAQHHRQEQDRIQSRLQRLTPRERQVLEYVIGGCLNKQIAAELQIAERTVKIYRALAMDKMEVTSVAALVRQCDAAGIARARSLPVKDRRPTLSRFEDSKGPVLRIP